MSKSRATSKKIQRVSKTNSFSAREEKEIILYSNGSTLLEHALTLYSKHKYITTLGIEARRHLQDRSAAIWESEEKKEAVFSRSNAKRHVEHNGHLFGTVFVCRINLILAWIAQLRECDQVVMCVNARITSPRLEKGFQDSCLKQLPTIERPAAVLLKILLDSIAILVGKDMCRKIEAHVDIMDIKMRVSKDSSEDIVQCT